MWSQVYDPFNNVWLSTMAAAIPVVVMLAALAFFHIKAHIAALMGLVAALVVAIWGFTMPLVRLCPPRCMALPMACSR